MMSKPAFVVEVNKGGSKKLAMHCVFPASDEYPPAAEHEAGDPYGLPASSFILHLSILYMKMLLIS